MTPARATFVWGLKRSGIHLLVNWLYANHGADVKEPLVDHDLHPQLRDGFRDDDAGVAFFNNIGRFSSRRFELGDLTPGELEEAAARQPATLFGVEDCDLRFAPRVTSVPDAVHVLVLRDPLNNLASRLEAARKIPEAFPINEGYIDLFADYCAEFLGRTDHLPAKIVVSYNRFVQDRRYRDGVASSLGLANRDAMSEVSPYGGGSSFTQDDLSPTAALMTRFHEHPVPRHLLDLLLDRPVIVEACATVFGYDLAAEARAL